jgi:hypothetical protein
MSDKKASLKRKASVRSLFDLSDIPTVTIQREPVHVSPAKVTEQVIRLDPKIKNRGGTIGAVVGKPKPQRYMGPNITRSRRSTGR